jgi:C1A family cysteine protease
MCDRSLITIRKLFACLAAFAVLFAIASFSDASQMERDEIQGAIHAKGGHWIAEETSISKLPPEQRKNRLGSLIPSAQKQTSAVSGTTAAPYTGTVPASLDWRNYNGYNYVTPVRDQGNCGSCWAFAATAALEANVLITKGSATDLSEQVLVSCGGAGSCSGGYIDRASNFILNIGLPAESYYTYTATNGSCSNAVAGWQNAANQISNWYWVATTSPTVAVIKDWLNNYGPLVTTMDVYSDFYYYSGGIYSYTSGSYQGGHAIVIVGYDDTNQYFIVKNSWGSGWGESGYFRIAYSEISSVAYFGQYTIAYYTSTAAPGVAVTSPNGSEQLQAGSTKTIQWTYTGNPGSSVKIDLLKGGVFNSTISSSTPIGSSGSGSYKWAIPLAQAIGTDYQMRITSTINAAYADFSDNYFSIISPPPPSITVVNPNGGQTWKRGSNQTISWTYTGNPGAYVKIELLKSSSVVSTISSNAKIGSAGQGNYRWRVPSTQTAGNDYTIRITSTSNSALADYSNNPFAISLK